MEIAKNHRTETLSTTTFVLPKIFLFSNFFMKNIDYLLLVLVRIASPINVMSTHNSLLLVPTKLVMC